MPWRTSTRRSGFRVHRLLTKLHGIVGMHHGHAPLQDGIRRVNFECILVVQRSIDQGMASYTTNHAQGRWCVVRLILLFLAPSLYLRYVMYVLLRNFFTSYVLIPLLWRIRKFSTGKVMWRVFRDLASGNVAMSSEAGFWICCWISRAQMAVGRNEKDFDVRKAFWGEERIE